MSTKNTLSKAQICAFDRVYHSNVSRDKVFDDYLVMGKEGYDKLYALISEDKELKSGLDSTMGTAEIIKEYLEPITLSRIGFAENKLKAFTAEHGSCQYVICGAGYDTFSFRNNNPEIEIFEVDHPNMQTFKKNAYWICSGTFPITYIFSGWILKRIILFRHCWILDLIRTKKLFSAY
jgi:O-Methyltransferase involved in polyketide biosynthesis